MDEQACDRSAVGTRDIIIHARTRQKERQGRWDCVNDRSSCSASSTSLCPPPGYSCLSPYFLTRKDPRTKCIVHRSLFSRRSPRFKRPPHSPFSSSLLWRHCHPVADRFCSCKCIARSPCDNTQAGRQVLSVRHSSSVTDWRQARWHMLSTRTLDAGHDARVCVRIQRLSQL